MSVRTRLLALAPMAAVGLAAAAVAAGADAIGALDRVEADSVDKRFELRGPRPVGDVALVAIDDDTFSDLDLRWPFPRTLHARVIDRLRAAGARQIAYDVQFTEPSAKLREDLALYDAAGRARHAVLATTEVTDRGATNVLGGDAGLRRIGARAANALMPRDGDGVVRRVPPHTIERLESFAVAIVEQATGRPLPSDGFAGAPYIDFQGPAGTVDALSFSRVLRGRFDPERVRGKVVVVGASAPSLQDLHPTAAGPEPMPGPEVLANATSTVLRDFPLRDAPGWLRAAAVLLLGLLAPLTALRLSVLRAAAVALAGLVAYAAAAKLAFDAGVVLAVTAPLLAGVLGTVGALGLRLAREARERRRTRELFGRFVPETVVEELLEASGTGMRLPGVARQATVMFGDLRGFTTFAESTEAELVLDVLNRYLSEMSDAILEHGGTVVSYMGDGIMAVFGSPVARPDHADAAVAAAREMLEVRLPRVNAWLAERRLPEFRMGVGLNSGSVMSGTVGSDRRLEYAAIGDTTNVAARLEAMTKKTGGGLLVADATRSLLRAGGVDLESCGELELRGRAEPVAVWTLPVADEDGPRQPAVARVRAPAST